MSMTSRLISRLTAISVKTGSLPLLSWSLSPSPKQAETTKHISYLDACKSAEEEDLRGFLGNQVAKGKKVVFLGEQHEQPGCVKAGLVVLDEMAQLARQGSHGGKREVVLVLEHFNVLQQGMLDVFSAPQTSQQITEARDHVEDVGDDDGRAAAQTLLSAYADDGTEGFTLQHYIPLLLHARFHSVPIVAGFPPRSWARVIAKEGVPALKEQQNENLALLGFDHWEDLEGSAAHRAMVRSMVRGEPPVLEPLPTDEAARKKGLYAAQAFKDAVLAFAVDREVEKRAGEALVLVLTGSGHCEYGLGAPERIRSVREEEVALVVCKSREGSGVWVGEGWVGAKGEAGKEGEGAKEGRKCADGIVFYDEV